MIEAAPRARLFLGVPGSAHLPGGGKCPRTKARPASMASASPSSKRTAGSTGRPARPSHWPGSTSPDRYVGWTYRSRKAGCAHPASRRPRFRLTETMRALQEFDGSIRHKLRCILWRQWQRPCTRAKDLMKAGLTEERAWRSARNQRGPCWNSGARSTPGMVCCAAAVLRCGAGETELRQLSVFCSPWT